MKTTNFPATIRIISPKLDPKRLAIHPDTAHLAEQHLDQIALYQLQSVEEVHIEVKMTKTRKPIDLRDD